jgi:hypothetical protein
MKIEDIVKLLEAKIHHLPQDYDVDIIYGGASDLMSDVLTYMSDLPAYVPKGMVLITGLLNPQVIRTAGLSDISAVIFTRGKVPNDKIIEKASKNTIAVMSTSHKTYTTCGLLYCSGLQSIDGNLFQKGELSSE